MGNGLDLIQSLDIFIFFVYCIMKKIGIYKITSPSGKIYIGQSVDIENRFKTYLRYSCKSQPKLFASLKKYGSENHKYEILHICTKEELSMQEKYYVDLFKSFESNNGLNVRDGGGNVAKLSEEQKIKISKSLTGKKHSLERINANIKAQTGKKLTECHKLKIKLSNKKANLGKKASIETRIKQSLAHKGQKTRLGSNLTDEQKKHLSEINLGINNPNYGIKKSEESKNKTSESLKRYWENKKKNGIKEFERLK